VPRYKDAPQVYEVKEQFRDRCLLRKVVCWKEPVYNRRVETLSSAFRRFRTGLPFGTGSTCGLVKNGAVCGTKLQSCRTRPPWNR